MDKQIEIYKAENGEALLEVTIIDETIWLTQMQIATLFDKDVRTINEHIQTILRTGELQKDPTIRKFRIVRQEGNRKVKREIDHYNLDMIISVGYRVNSLRGTHFRQWATGRLSEYLVRGYAINKQRLEERQKEVQVLRDGIRIISRALDENMATGQEAWLNQFTRGLALLDDYDHSELDSSGYTEKPVFYPDNHEYMHLIKTMKSDFYSSIFAKPKDSSFQSSINQIRQVLGGKDLYPSLEEKAATLLYLIVKNHSFVDGNKRIAAACFLYFLKKNKGLYKNDRSPIISNEALASITLFVAISKTEEKETVIRLIISVLNRNQIDDKKDQI